MTCRRIPIGLLLVLASAAPLAAADVSAKPKPDVLTARIDGLLAARWSDNKVQPAAVADDAEFLRRITLDLTGRIPTVGEVRAFLADPALDKRHKVVEQLLASSTSVRHFANVWRSWLLPPVNSEFEDPGIRQSFEAWLRKNLEGNTPYDKMVREIITTVVAPQRGEVPFATGQFGGAASPAAFYQTSEATPENMGANASRLFLGVKLECAQCHNHPFATWTREQFWQFASFYVSPRTKPMLRIPGTTTTVQAEFLDGKKPDLSTQANLRAVLADWVVSPENKYFARAAVNRLWGHFFGHTVIDPVDDLSEIVDRNELLDELASQFCASGFDLKFLIRALVSTQAYHLSSTSSHVSQKDPLLFARMAVKGLSPEQLYDSLLEAARFPQASMSTPRAAAIAALERQELLSRFTNRMEKPAEVETSILQALALMNGKFIGDATSLQRSETLGAVADAPFLSTAEKIESLYLASLSRKPREKELTRLVSYVEKGGPSGDPKRALADVFWALLNSSEFILNH